MSAPIFGMDPSGAVVQWNAMVATLTGRSKEEVAAELSLTIPALKARLHRVREGLKARMLSVA